MALLFLYDYGQGGFQFHETFDVVPALGIQYNLAVDGLSAPLVFLTAFIYLTGITTTWYLKKREKEFFLFLGLLVTGVFGVFTSLDLLLFFLFYTSSGLVAGGKLFEGVFGLPYLWAVSVGALAIILYTAFGGFLGNEKKRAGRSA